LKKSVDFRETNAVERVSTVTEYPGGGRTPLVTVEKYDYAGRLTEHTSQNNIITTRAYDKNGILTSESSSMGTDTGYAINRWGQVTSKNTKFDNTDNAVTDYRYDKNGSLIKESVKNNRSGQAVSYRETEYRNDAWGNVLAVIPMDGNSPESYIISAYDWAGRLTGQHKGLGGSDVNYATLAITANNGDYSTLSYEYDYLGNVKKSTDAMSGVELMTYYPSGLLRTMTDRNGTVHTVEYDKNGNITDKTSVNGLDSITAQYTYDGVGNLETIDDGASVIVYEYDGLGNLVAETQGERFKCYSRASRGLCHTK